MNRTTATRLIALLMLAGCTTSPTPPPTVAATAAPAATVGSTSSSATRFGPKFQALLDDARKSDGQLRGGMDGYTPEFIRAMEGQFSQEFGIKISLQNEPGHGSREIPPKMVQAQKVGKGLVDWIDNGNPSNFAPLMQQDALQAPDWEALAEQWPEIADLRKMYPDVPGGPNGTTLQDYCMLSTQATWVFVYNTHNVTADEARSITWNSLLADSWKGRVAWDAQALGFKELPFSSAWPMERFKAYTNNLGANSVKLIAGGTNGVVQAVTQGEGDVGMAEAGTVIDQLNQGAPLAIAWPDIIPFNSLGTCMPKITLDNRALAEIFFAWRDIEGEWLRAKMGAGGARPYYAAEADKFPLAKMAKDAGVAPERLAQPQSVADFDQVEQNRQTAIAALKAGLQTGQKLPYTW